MNTKDLNSLFSDLTNEKIELFILDNQNAKKWYDKTYSKCETIAENCIYGVLIDNTICFDFKVGKFDNLLKTFVTQYVSKYLIKKQILDNGMIRNMTISEAKNSLLNNNIRLSTYLFYSTNYGIGLHNLFVSKQVFDKCKNLLSEILQTNNTSFKNEYSDALWAYRFIFDGNFLDHNKVIEQIKLKLQ